MQSPFCSQQWESEGGLQAPVMEAEERRTPHGGGLGPFIGVWRLLDGRDDLLESSS